MIFSRGRTMMRKSVGDIHDTDLFVAVSLICFALKSPWVGAAALVLAGMCCCMNMIISKSERKQD